MKLEERHIQKIDSLLRDALRDAKGDEVLRAVMVLGPQGIDARKEYRDQELASSQFPSHEAYRKALIERRQSELVHDTGETRQALEDLSLSLRGGKISKTVVVEGSARQILASLELSGVRHASLDQPIGLIAPRRRGDKRSKN